MYVNGEADMTITAFRYDGESGIFEELHYLSTLPQGATGGRFSTAQIEVAPPGRFVYVITQTGLDPGAIVVPSTAVQNSQSGSTVYVLKPDQTVELRKVKVARTAGDNSLLASGVKANETVVTDGQLRLLPGMKAEPRAPSGAPLKVETASSDKSGNKTAAQP